MTDPMTTIEAEVAKALVQAGVNGLTKLAKKVPALFKRQGKTKERHVTDEIERTVTRLQVVTGSELEREQTRQEAAWEVLLRGLLVEYPDAAEDFKTLAAEINAALPDTRSVHGVVGVVNVGRDSHIAGRDITINQHNPDRGDSQLELPAVTLTTTGSQDDSSAVLDLKLRNIGGQPALLHRATFHIHDAVSLSPYYMVGFMPYYELLVRGALYVSHTYDIVLPDPEQARGSHHNLDLSQAIEPVGTDRFHIRLGIPRTHDTLVYLLHFDIHYDANRILTSPTIAIAHPPGSRLVTPDEIRNDLHHFHEAIREVRDSIDRELTIRGLPPPDWDNHPPTSRKDLPTNLRSVDGDPEDVLGLHPGTYEVNDTFWNPGNSLTQHLYDIHAYCARVVSIITGADIRHDFLPQTLTQAQTILTELPALHAGLITPEKAITVQEPTPSDNPDVTDELAGLLGGQHLEELRARANAGEQDAARLLDAAASLADKIRLLGPDHPETLHARENLIFWQVGWDKAGAAVALAKLIPDQVRVYGPDHPQTFRARHYLGMCRGETGDAAGAAVAFAELVPDRIRVLGPDHPDTLKSLHELARWRAMAGDAAGAAAAFAELVPDYIRVLGPDHPDTLKSQQALVHWRDQLGPESEA